MIRLAKVAAAIASITAGVVVIPPGATGASDCTTTVASTSAAVSAVAAAAPGASICLADGTYGKLTLNATKAAPGVTIRAEHPGQATIAGAALSGSYLTLAQFRITGTFDARPGSTGMRADHNLFVGGSYYAVMAAATTTTTVNDVAITNNRFDGRFDEDAIRLNRYHDGPDADDVGILIEGNEFLGNVEYGGHNDVLQTVWVGDHLVFRRNYLHDFGGQGFFVKDQNTAIQGITVEDNLIVDQDRPCDPVSLCPTWQLIPFQIFGPASDVVIRHNTVWPGSGGGQAWLRGSGWSGAVTITDNVFDDLNSDATGLTLASSNNSRCASNGLASAGFAADCHPAFADAANGDYRLASGRGVTWSVADQHFGPTGDAGATTTPPPVDPTPTPEPVDTTPKPKPVDTTPKPGPVPTPAAPTGTAPTGTAPTVKLATSVADRAVDLEATARDDRGIARVEFWVDGTRVARDTRAPYRARLAVRDVKPGIHTIAVRAFDGSGQAASAATTTRVVAAVSRRQPARFGRALPTVDLRAAGGGDGVTKLAGRTDGGAVLRVALARCGSASVLDRFDATADDEGRIDVTYAGRDVCIRALQTDVRSRR